jgi:hypothetical protein
MDVARIRGTGRKRESHSHDCAEAAAPIEAMGLDTAAP